jgi:uncharacterized protein YndB with AHSA1/START domain
MPITSVTSDADLLTMTVVGEYDVPVTRLWDAFCDPRQIERFWGPPEWPARFTRHDVVAGGRSAYFMTGPEGERSAGYWTFERVDEGAGFEVIDGFATDDGTPNEEMPTMRIQFSFEPTDTGSRFRSVTTFSSVEVMEELVKMGMVEGATAALGQMDAVLADLASFAAGRVTEAEMLDDTRVRCSRAIRGSVDDVWRAHLEPQLVRKWMLGPDGWSMPVCETATEVGQRYRYEWEADDGTGRFGFEGELIEMDAPRRAVQTERMIGTDGPSVRNEMTLTPVGDGTVLTVVITYPNAELRDEILATGMVDGMEASYARLEAELGSSTT